MAQRVAQARPVSFNQINKTNQPIKREVRPGGAREAVGGRVLDRTDRD
jgi:hypothetical protein